MDNPNNTTPDMSAGIDRAETAAERMNRAFDAQFLPAAMQRDWGMNYTIATAAAATTSPGQTLTFEALQRAREPIDQHFSYGAEDPYRVRMGLLRAAQALQIPVESARNYTNEGLRGLIADYSERATPPVAPSTAPSVATKTYAPSRPRVNGTKSALRWFVSGSAVGVLLRSGTLIVRNRYSNVTSREIGHARSPEEANLFLQVCFDEFSSWGQSQHVEIEHGQVLGNPHLRAALPALAMSIRSRKGAPSGGPFAMTRSYGTGHPDSLSWPNKGHMEDGASSMFIRLTNALRDKTKARGALKRAADRVKAEIQKLPTRAGNAYWDDLREAVRELGDALDSADILMSSVGLQELATYLSDMAEEKGLSLWGERLIEKLDCGHWATYDDEHYHTHDGDSFCGDCKGDNTYVTVDDEYHLRGNVYHWARDDEYHLEPEPEDEDEDDERDSSGLLRSWGSSTGNLSHDRSFTPCSDGDFTMGVELEVEVERYTRRSTVLRNCEDHFNGAKTYAMFKSDGSLSCDKGFEIVTAARRMGDHIEAFKDWEPENLTSWDSGHCGLHVHIDSRAFTPLSVGKFLMFYSRTENKRLIKSVAGRHPADNEQARQYARALSDTRTPQTVKQGNNSRYFMVNVVNLSEAEQERLGIEVNRDCKGNYSTVEIRIFRGSLRKERLLAQIEFAHASVVFCRTASWSDLSETAFKAWLSHTAGYPHLTHWLGAGRARNKNRVNAEEHASEGAEV